MPAIICFGQQPCGFFPKRFLVAKIRTARELQRQIGGEIVFFYHDADHDPRETKTILRHRQSGQPLPYNFDFENKIQRKFSPLFLKRIPAEWHKKMIGTLPNYVANEWVQAFADTPPTNVADFCLSVYRHMGLLEGIRVARSGDPLFREAACDISDYFADLPFEHEIVRARLSAPDVSAHLNASGHGVSPRFHLHEGGSVFINVPTSADGISKSQVSPTRDTRLRWMQSVLHCTHYVAGAGEQDYLNKADAPEIEYVSRMPIERSDEAWVGGD